MFWPERSEFVRMAARFGATIIPFGAVGEDDLAQVSLKLNFLNLSLLWLFVLYTSTVRPFRFYILLELVNLTQFPRCHGCLHALIYLILGVV